MLHTNFSSVCAGLGQVVSLLSSHLCCSVLSTIPVSRRYTSIMVEVRGNADDLHLFYEF